MRRALVLLAVLLASCRDRQPGPAGTLADACAPVTAAVDTSAAVDLLFVVDDSFSMDPIQASLAKNLRTFIERVAQKQRDRLTAGKEPFDLHIAVTTTSVLVNRSGAGLGDCTGGTCIIAAPALGGPAYSYACTAGPCADIVTRYYAAAGSQCLPGVMKANGDPFPAGSFVGAGTNPTVLSFTRDLDWANASSDLRIRSLIAQFEANVAVGSCGASQEMPFEAARRAIEKGLAGQQGAAWPHANSRIGVVFVSNEDDCSTRRADEGGLAWDGSVQPDRCEVEAQGAASSALVPIGDYASFFTGLGRPFSAAFIRPGFPDCRSDGGPGTRTGALAKLLAGAGVPVLEASVCGDIVAAEEGIAGTVEPPDWLELPDVGGAPTQLQVSRADGAHVCEGPDLARDWWFVDCTTGGALPAGHTSACVKVKPGSACEPTPQAKLQVRYPQAASAGCASGQG